MAQATDIDTSSQLASVEAPAVTSHSTDTSSQLAPVEAPPVVSNSITAPALARTVNPAFLLFKVLVGLDEHHFVLQNSM